MAAIIRTGWKGDTEPPAEAQAASVSDAWQLWHLTLEQWTDFGERQFQDPTQGS
jgi:hypothetical protein